MPKKAARKATTEEDTGPITLDIMRLEPVTFHLQGKTPLLSNNWSEESRDIREKEEAGLLVKNSGSKSHRDIEKDWQGTRHFDEIGRDVWPASGLHRSVTVAGYRFGGQVKAVLQGLFTIPQLWLPIESPPPHMRRDFGRAADIKRTRLLIYRAEYWPWKIEVPVLYDPSKIRIEALAGLFERAGMQVGLGAWRPENSGQFGTFTIGSEITVPDEHIVARG